jgi:small subunit ribosomal protein S9
VNHRTFEAFFPTEALRMQIRTPLVLTETADKFDILATVAGGGVSGQAGAVRLGIARALVEYNAELRKPLKSEGLLTRDARAKERKKYGMAGARKRFQFSKALRRTRRRVFGRDCHEGSTRGWRSFRPPDQAVEPEDEGIHLRRTQRHLHH